MTYGTLGFSERKRQARGEVNNAVAMMRHVKSKLHFCVSRVHHTP